RYMAPRPASRSRQITRQLALEFGEVARDHRHVEAPEDRLLRLAVEQEAERRLDAALRRMLAAGEPLEGLLPHRDAVTRLPLALGDQPLKFERLARADAPNLDHVDLHGKRLSAVSSTAIRRARVAPPSGSLADAIRENRQRPAARRSTDRARR